MNDVRAVEVAGRQAVARTGKRSADDLDWEIHLLSFLRSAGLPVPHLVPTTDGRLRSGTTIVMERVDGVLPETDGDWRRVDRYLHRLHELTVGWGRQRPGWLSCADLVTESRSGPVDLSVLPADVLTQCRAAWERLPEARHCVVHGDPSPPNIRVTADTVVLLDWDEARIDNPFLDFGYIPAGVGGVAAGDQRAGRNAFYAWETAMFWELNPEHAKRRLAKLD